MLVSLRVALFTQFTFPCVFSLSVGAGLGFIRVDVTKPKQLGLGFFYLPCSVFGDVLSAGKGLLGLAVNGAEDGKAIGRSTANAEEFVLKPLRYFSHF